MKIDDYEYTKALEFETEAAEYLKLLYDDLVNTFKYKYPTIAMKLNNNNTITVGAITYISREYPRAMHFADPDYDIHRDTKAKIITQYQRHLQNTINKGKHE